MSGSSSGCGRGSHVHGCKLHVCGPDCPLWSKSEYIVKGASEEGTMYLAGFNKKFATRTWSGYRDDAMRFKSHSEAIIASKSGPDWIKNLRVIEVDPRC